MFHDNSWVNETFTLTIIHSKCSDMLTIHVLLKGHTDFPLVVYDGSVNSKNSFTENQLKVPL